MDIELLNSESLLKGLRYPHKIKDVTHVVMTAGEFSCIVDFHSYSLKAPAVAIFLPGQIVESIETDDKFSGFGMVMSEDFTDSLNLPVGLQERLLIKNVQWYSISEECLEAFRTLYMQLSNLMKQVDNPYREEIVRHLFSAHYYGLGYYLHGQQRQSVQMSSQQDMCERFISLLSENFKEHREIAFYADKLCTSNKYLSTLLKQETGMTALEWIERYVVLYAKSCLTSTSMTIQQISDELDFPSQSVFGKYFKRVEGISPKAYRQSLSSNSATM